MEHQKHFFLTESFKIFLGKHNETDLGIILFKYDVNQIWAPYGYDKPSFHYPGAWSKALQEPNIKVL